MYALAKKHKSAAIMYHMIVGVLHDAAAEVLPKDAKAHDPERIGAIKQRKASLDERKTIMTDTWRPSGGGRYSGSQDLLHLEHKSQTQ